MKRKRQRCAKLPRIFDASIVTPIAIARLDTPQACNWRDGRRPGQPGAGRRSSRILLIFH
jgi:hypothetical protein